MFRLGGTELNTVTAILAVLWLSQNDIGQRHISIYLGALKGSPCQGSFVFGPLLPCAYPPRACCSPLLQLSMFLFQLGPLVLLHIGMLFALKYALQSAEDLLLFSLSCVSRSAADWHALTCAPTFAADWHVLCLPLDRVPAGWNCLPWLQLVGTEARHQHQ